MREPKGMRDKVIEISVSDWHSVCLSALDSILPGRALPPTAAAPVTVQCLLAESRVRRRRGAVNA